MMKKFLFILLALVGIGYAIDLSACPANLNVPSGQYILTTDVSSATTCFTILNNNITLDCNGHSITHIGKENASSYGVSFSTRYNITVRNCLINNFTGITLGGNADRATLLNNTISAGTLQSITAATSRDLQILNSSLTSYNNTALRLTTMWRVNVTNNTIIAWNNASAYGIYMIDARNATIFNNTIITNATSGFYEARSTKTNFSNNTVSVARGYGLYITTSSNNSIYFGNFITKNSSGAYTVYVDVYSTNNTFDNNTIYSNSTIGIYIYRSNNNTIKFSTVITNNTASAIQVNQGNSTRIYNTTIINNGIATTAYGLYITTSKFNEISNNTITANRATYAAILIGTTTGGGNNLVQNNTLDGNTIYLKNSTGYAFAISFGLNNTFKNGIAQVGRAGSPVYLANSNYTTISSSTILGNISYGIYTIGASFSNFSNDTISTIGATSVGMYLTSSRWLLFENITVNGSTGNAIVFNAVYDTIVKNSTIFRAATPSATRGEIYFFKSGNITIYNTSIGTLPFGGVITSGCNSNSSIVNSTFNRSNMRWLNPSAPLLPCPSLTSASNETIVKWHINFSVASTNGSIMAGSTVNASTKQGVQIFSYTTDDQGNIINLTEISEFKARGYFKYNTSEQENVTFYTNHTFQATQADFISNITNKTINQSFTPFPFTLAPVIPRIVFINISKVPPYWEDATNTTYPWATVSDINVSDREVNASVWYPNMTIIYANQTFVTNDSLTNNYTFPNFTTPIWGTYLSEIYANDKTKQAIVNKSASFNFVNQTNIALCPYQTVVYRTYTINSQVICAPDADGINLVTGVRLDIYASFVGTIMEGAPIGLQIAGDNITIIGHNDSATISGFHTQLIANNTNNLTIVNISTLGTDATSILLNDSYDFYLSNSSHGVSSGGGGDAVTTIFITNSRGTLTNLTADILHEVAGSRFLWIANTTNITLQNIYTDQADGEDSYILISDSNYTTLDTIHINNVSTVAATQARTSPHTIVKCERCNYFTMYSSYLVNASVGLNLTDSNNTRAVFYNGSAIGGFGYSSIYTANVLQDFATAGIYIYSTSQDSSSYNDLYYYTFTRAVQSIHLEGLTTFVNNTRLINFTITIPKAANARGLYSANASNTSLINSTVRYVGSPLGTSIAQVEEATLSTVKGTQCLRLENTTINLTNFTMGDSPNQDIYVGYGGEFYAGSDTGDTAVNKNVSNVSGSQVYSNTNATMNTTDWLGILGMGITNKTCLPNMCVNETNHTFSVAGVTYGGLNMTNLSMTQPRFVNLTVFYDVGLCGRVVGPITLEADVTIIVPTCFIINKPDIVFNCNGFSLISAYPSATAFDITSSAVGATINNCVINSTTGAYFAVFNQSAQYGSFNNITGSFNGNLTSITNSHQIFSNVSVMDILSSADKGFIVGGLMIGMTNLTISNSTITGGSVDGGTLLSISPAMAASPTLNISNSTIRTTGNTSRLLYANFPFGSIVLENSALLQDNIYLADEGIWIESNLLTATLSNLTTSTNRSIHITSATTTNTSINVTDLVMASAGTWYNSYSANAYMFYAANNSPCSLCLINITDILGNEQYFFTGSDGYAREIPLPQFQATGGSLGGEDSYFILNGSTQTNETSGAELLYYNPYIFSSISGAYAGSNSTSIIYTNQTIIIMLQKTTVDIEFVLQDPADINSFNAFGGGVNITYNVTAYYEFDTDSLKIFFKTNTTSTDNLIWINGTLADSWINDTYVLQDGINYTFNALDNEIYPADYNILQITMEASFHNATALTGQNQYARVRMMNFSTIKNYSFFEIMAYNTTVNAAPLRFYYCNSTYQNGLVQLSPNCAQIGTLTAGTPYNHTPDGGKSAHHALAIGLNGSGYVGSVVATGNSTFLVRGANVGNWNVSFINNLSRPDAAQTSINGGNTWTDLEGTYDAHVHQYDGNESVWYYVCGNLSSPLEMYGNCTPVRQDLIQLGGLPPSAPNIIVPTNEVYSGNLNITYTPATSPNAYAITTYNISILYVNGTFNATIMTNNSPNLNFTWNSFGYRGNYTIQVEACDINGLCSRGISEEFKLESCMNLMANTTLVRNVSASGTCYTIGADDITLDCDGYTITGDGSGFGVFNLGYANVSVKNCNISNFTIPIYFTSGAFNASLYNLNLSNYSNAGIFLNYSNNASIYFISANSTAHGIWLNYANYSIISNSTVTATNANKYGIYLVSSSYNSISNSTGAGPLGYGIYFITASNYNTIDNSTGSSTGSGAIELASSSSYNNITNSTGIGAVGIRLNAPFNRLVNSTGISTSGYGISIAGNNNTILNSTGISTSDAGMYIGNRDNNITSSSGVSTSGSGTSLRASAASSIIINATFISASGVGVNLTDTAVDNNQFINSSINSATGFDIFTSGGAGNNTFINTTFNRSNIGWGTGLNNLTVGWFPDAKTIYTNTSACDGCSLNVTNSTGGVAQYSLITDALGYVRMLNLTEFFANGSFIYNGSNQINITFYNLHNFTANKTGYYGTNSTQINASGEVVIVLNSLFSQTNYSWVQDTNITDYIEANWSIKVYVDGSGTANVSLLMNRTGALWVQNASGNYVGFTNGSSWISWPSGTNVSQNWTVIMQTEKMTCAPISGMGWSTRQNAKLCTISQPNYPNTTVSVLITNESVAQEIRTCAGIGTGPGNACDKTVAAVWIPTIPYTLIPGYIYRYGENFTMIRYYMLLWDTVAAGGGGDYTPPINVTQNVTNQTVQPPIGEAEPITAGLLAFVSNLYPFFKENFWLLIILGGAFVIVDIKDGKTEMTWLGKVGAGLIILGAVFALGVA